MKVFVKVVMNQAEINAANQHNQRNAQIREQQKLQKGAAKKHFVPVEDVEVPEQIIDKKPMFLDLSKVVLASIGDAGMIQIIYEGLNGAINTDYDEEIWAQLEQRFTEKN